jgi:hypothetical protein
VPGSVGVRGASSMLSGGNISDGITFTFKMIMIGILLSIGVFVGLLPKNEWAKSIRKQKRAMYIAALAADLGGQFGHVLKKSAKINLQRIIKTSHIGFSKLASDDKLSMKPVDRVSDTLEKGTHFKTQDIEISTDSHALPE